ncbi:hypothetical protein BDV10DRAFT_15192 [Aspergillus recurvatus]
MDIGHCRDRMAMASDVMPDRARNLVLELESWRKWRPTRRENTERRFLPEKLTGEPPQDFQDGVRSTVWGHIISSWHHLSESLLAFSALDIIIALVLVSYRQPSILAVRRVAATGDAGVLPNPAMG